MELIRSVLVSVSISSPVFVDGWVILLGQRLDLNRVAGPSNHHPMYQASLFRSTFLSFPVVCPYHQRRISKFFIVRCNPVSIADIVISDGIKACYATDLTQHLPRGIVH